MEARKSSSASTTIHLFIAIDYLDHQPYFLESYLMPLVMVRPHRGIDCSLAVPEA